MVGALEGSPLRSGGREWVFGVPPGILRATGEPSSISWVAWGREMGGPHRAAGTYGGWGGTYLLLGLGATCVCPFHEGHPGPGWGTPWGQCGMVGDGRGDTVLMPSSRCVGHLWGHPCPTLGMPQGLWGYPGPRLGMPWTPLGDTHVPDWGCWHQVGDSMEDTVVLMGYPGAVGLPSGGGRHGDPLGTS